MIIAFGGLLRGLYLGESVNKPDFTHPLSDAGFHDYWARALVSGNWGPPADNPDPHINSVPFVRPPGYPYFLALVYSMTGESYVGARIAQAALGLLNCWLAYLLGCAVFRRSIGLILAAMMAVYWALIYIEIELHDPVLLITLSLLFFLMMHDWLRKPSVWRLATGGLLLGLMILVRPNVAVFAPAVAIWVWWQARRKLLPAAVIAASAMLAILPATMRNVVVADDLVAVSANGAINLYIGNNPGADGVSTRIPDLQEFTGQAGWSCYSFDQIVRGVGAREGRPMKYSDVDRYFLKRGLQEIAGDPGRFLRLTARRAALFWGPAEVSNNKAVAIEKADSTVLRLIPGFPVVLALALLGGGLLWLDRRHPIPVRAVADTTVQGQGPMLALVLFYIGTIFASYLPFLVAERFRIPLLPYLFLFGSYSVWRLATFVAKRVWGSALKMVVLGAALVLVCSYPLVKYESDRAWWHTDKGAALTAAGDIQGAAREYQAALRENPGYVDANVGLANALAAMGRYAEAISHFQTVIQHRPSHLEARTGLSAALNLSGQPAAAVTQLREILTLSPRSAQAHFELGRALSVLQQYAEAEIELREALRLSPDFAFARVNLGIVLARKGDQRGAIREYREALLINPGNPEALVRLGMSLCKVDSLVAGAESLERAVALRPGDSQTVEQIALLFFQDGRMSDAERWYRRAVQMTPNRAINHGNLAMTLANLSRFDAAIAEMRIAIQLDPDNRTYLQSLQQIQAVMQRK